MICTLCIVSHALPGTIWQPYSSGGLRCAPTEPRRIALQHCTPAILLMQMLDPDIYPFHPASLVICFQYCPLGRRFDEPLSFRTISSPGLSTVAGSNPGSVEALSSSSRVSRSSRTNAEPESKGINLHSLCQNHRNLIICGAVSPALDAQLFRPYGSQEVRRVAFGLLTCAPARLNIRQYHALNKK
jgi:hypothetical protein